MASVFFAGVSVAISEQSYGGYNSLMFKTFSL